jgi:hypothetical protein
VNTDKSILVPSSSIPALGYTLSHQSIIPTDDYLSSITEFEVRPTHQSLRKFLGKLSHIHQSYPNLLPHRAALFSVLTSYKGRSSLHLSPSAQAHISSIKRIVQTPTPLTHLNPSIPLQLFSDAGDTGYSARLLQDGRLIGQISRNLVRTTTYFTSHLSYFYSSSNNWCKLITHQRLRVFFKEKEKELEVEDE